MKKCCSYLSIILFFILLLPFFSLYANEDKEPEIDVATNMIWTGASFGYQFPAGKISQTFKNNFNLGTGFSLKTAASALMRFWTSPDSHFILIACSSVLKAVIVSLYHKSDYERFRLGALKLFPNYRQRYKKQSCCHST